MQLKEIEKGKFTKEKTKAYIPKNNSFLFIVCKYRNKTTKEMFLHVFDNVEIFLYFLHFHNSYNLELVEVLDYNNPKKTGLAT